jgi:hypothetical protein
MSGYLNVLRMEASRQIISTQFRFNDVFTAVSSALEFDESVTADESPRPSSSGTNSTADETEIVGLAGLAG